MNVNGPDPLLGVLHGFIIYSRLFASPDHAGRRLVSRVVFSWSDWEGVVKRIAGGHAAAHAFRVFEVYSCNYNCRSLLGS